MKAKVMIAMSGGVDSSVAAHLLKEQGYDVTGVTMCLGLKQHEEEPVSCCGGQAIEDARRVCDKLGIPHYVMDFAVHLEEKVIHRFKTEYLRGRTPNPCIDCNRYLKFGGLLDRAMSLGFDFLATGHYARIEEVNGKPYLKKPKDEKKDQTYFLYSVPRGLFSHILFPLAPYLKSEVRDMAGMAGLPTARKAESQDICFITKNSQSRLFAPDDNVRPGEIRDQAGNKLGEHKGVVFYTIGQRAGLKISHKHPLYVLSIDADNNRLIVGGKDKLRQKGLIARDCNILADHWPGRVSAKIRYRKKEAACRVAREEDAMRIIFEEEQEAITPGQAVVCYHDDLVLGGGIIEEAMYGYCS